MKHERLIHILQEQYVLEHGYPAYITSVGWLGYDQDKIRNLCEKALAEGWTRYAKLSRKISEKFVG